MLNKMILIAFLCLLGFSQQSFPSDLSTVPVDLSDPKQGRDQPVPIGSLNDLYVHFNLDPTTIDLPEVGGDVTKALEILMSTTEVWNRDSFNPVNFNLVVSGFSIASEDTGGKQLELDTDFYEGETHMVVHMSDIVTAAQALGGGLYDGKDRAYALASVWDAGFTHMDRTNGPHEIGHLMGMPHTHAASRNWPNEISVDIDYCGGSPRGRKECFTAPEFGGTLMSYCHECPVETAQGQISAFYRAKALTSFHPFIAMKLQERYESMKHNLADISYPNRLRTFIPEGASRNRCAREGQNCRCNGIVYFGPTVSSSSAKIFAVAESSGSVRCSSGANEAFPDVLHGHAKSCYCHANEDLLDVNYLPTEVEFTNSGVGECQFNCRIRHECRWGFNKGYFDLDGQPEWKCKQDCLDRNDCQAYNHKNGKCRLYQRPPVSVVNSGEFSGSTCWMRPQGNIAREQQAQHQLFRRGGTSSRWGSWSSWSACSGRCESGTQTRTRRCIGSGCRGSSSETRNCAGDCPTSTWGSWSRWSQCSKTCGSGSQSRTRQCNGSGCVGSSSESRNCNERECDTVTGNCDWVAVAEADCPSRGLSTMRECSENMSPGELCEADRRLPNGNDHDIDNCPGRYDVFRYECAGSSICDWVPVPERECPLISVMASMSDCHEGMDDGELCEADRRLPNGRSGNDLDNCDGYDIFRYTCSNSPTPNPEWDAWTSWSSCSAECGPGSRRRTRNCLGDGCVGESSQSRSCNEGPCTGSWSPWTSWSACSASCGSGTESRGRNCNGSNCVGDSSQNRACNAGPCDNISSGDFQLMGFGYCLTPNGWGVEGMVRFDLTGDECREACESRNDCIGYAGQISRKYTCYIYGPYHGSKPSGWSGVSGTGTEIARGSENFQTMNCYKRV